MGERQHACDFTVFLGQEIERSVAERLFDDAPPARKVEERAVGMAVDEAVPRLLFAGFEHGNDDCGHVALRLCSGYVPAISENTSSMRPHAKSSSNREIRRSIAPRLV